METATKKSKKVVVKNQDPIEEHLPVYKTFNYDQFNFVKANRPISQSLLKELIEAFRIEYHLTICNVNEKMDIIDGQHRILACKALNEPVRYVIDSKAGINEIKGLNKTGQRWEKKEFLHLHTTLGVEPYVQMTEFMKKYPEFQIEATLVILTNKMSGVENYKTIPGSGENRSRYTVKDFEEGKFFIENIELADERAAKIYDFHQYYPKGYTALNFVKVITAFLNKKDYNHNHMVTAFSKHKQPLYNNYRLTELKIILDEIYHKNASKKVNLLY